MIAFFGKGQINCLFVFAFDALFSARPGRVGDFWKCVRQGGFHPDPDLEPDLDSDPDAPFSTILDKKKLVEFRRNHIFCVEID